MNFDLTQKPSGATAVEFHTSCFSHSGWPLSVPTIAESTVWHWIAQNHRNNSLLWDEEDLARRTKASDAEITANKRAIDKYNQARNDATERVDEFLLLHLGLIDAATIGTDQPRSTTPADARLNSETAGSMIDRMSIMALKIRAMTAQTLRTDVDQAHRDGALLAVLISCWPIRERDALTSRSIGSSRCTTIRALILCSLPSKTPVRNAGKFFKRPKIGTITMSIAYEPIAAKLRLGGGRAATNDRPALTRRGWL
jgi:hypothetical protein